MKSKLDLQGNKFGRLTALCYISGSRVKKAKWHCICDCGNKKDVSTSNLTSGKTKSCGCLKTTRLALKE